MRIALALASSLALAAAPAAPADPAVTSPGLVDPSGAWRGVRWGMTVEEVLAHFKGEARRMDPELKLADGNTVSLRLDGLQLVGQRLRAGFVFGEGKLALVSLRTLEGDHPSTETFKAAATLLGEAFGAPGTATSDDSVVDLRQVSWELPRGGVDLKYIPGVMVILYRPPAVTGPPRRLE